MRDHQLLAIVYLIAANTVTVPDSDVSMQPLVALAKAGFYALSLFWGALSVLEFVKGK